MNNSSDFIDYLVDFNIGVIFLKGLEDTPIFNRSKMTWEFKPTVKTNNYAIIKGEYDSHIVFRIPNVFQSIKYKHQLEYSEHLRKHLKTFIGDLGLVKTGKDEKEYQAIIIEYRTKLKKSRDRVESSQVCYNPEIDFDNYLKEYLYHKDTRPIYSNICYRDNANEIGYLNYLIAEMVVSQIQVIDDTIEFLDNELKTDQSSNITLESPKNEITVEQDENVDPVVAYQRGFKRMRFLTNINVLATLFYDLKKKKYIDTSTTNLEKFILESFSDNNGESLKKSTIETILKSSREDKKAKDDVRIKVPDL